MTPAKIQRFRALITALEDVSDNIDLAVGATASYTSLEEALWPIREDLLAYVSELASLVDEVEAGDSGAE